MTSLVTLPLNLIPCYSLGNFKFTTIDTEQSELIVKLGL